MLDPRYNPPYRLPKNPRDWIDPRRKQMQLNRQHTIEQTKNTINDLRTWEDPRRKQMRLNRQRTLEQARNNPNDPMNWRNPQSNEMRLNHLRTSEQNKNNPISHSQFREDYNTNTIIQQLEEHTSNKSNGLLDNFLSKISSEIKSSIAIMEKNNKDSQAINKIRQQVSIFDFQKNVLLGHPIPLAPQIPIPLLPAVPILPAVPVLPPVAPPPIQILGQSLAITIWVLWDIYKAYEKPPVVEEGSIEIEIKQLLSTFGIYSSDLLDLILRIIRLKREKANLYGDQDKIEEDIENIENQIAHYKEELNSADGMYLVHVMNELERLNARLEELRIEYRTTNYSTKENKERWDELLNALRELFLRLLNSLGRGNFLKFMAKLNNILARRGYPLLPKRLPPRR